MGLKEQFRKAGVSYRGVPFWSWNDDLVPDALRSQVAEMAKAGLGGHFMHARKGLITEYMGPAWMDCIRAAIAASKESGIRAWLYDENCWPSGAAGGAVPAKSKDFVARRLAHEAVDTAAFRPQEGTVAVFLVRTGSHPIEIRQIDPKTPPRKAKPNEQVLHFFTEPLTHHAQPVYADVLNPLAVKEFIHHTYEGYRKAVGREFGKTIPGIFTDEPQWGYLPWSVELPRFFRKFKGYPLEPNLPLLVLETGEFRGFRYDFWHAATELFVGSFTKQIGQWCANHKLAFTGHFMAEDSLASQMHYIGAAMPHYEHMQVPGIDQLCRWVRSPVFCKQVSSVAHQFHGRRVLSEMFGCTGWNVSFEELKWLAEWQFALGVDLVCQHLSLYSARGSRKRDYPPSLHHQQPWWDDYRLLNDYFARLTFLLTRGRHVADILVLHPIESAWAAWKPDDPKPVDALDEKLVALAKALIGMHYDFDFGDESILARHGRVTSRRLRVNACEYAVVIVPRCVTLRGSTLLLLERMLDRGGTVILTGAPPELVDGRPSDRPAQVLRRAVRAKLSPGDLRAELAKILPPRITVLGEDAADAADIYVQQRDAGMSQLFFLANTSADNATTATVRLPTGRLERWDPLTGDTEPLPTQKHGKGIETVLRFEPMASHFLVLHKRRRPAVVRVPKRRTVEVIQLADAWALERSDPNALTVDYCAYRIGDGDWTPPMPVLRVQDNLRHITGSQVCEFRYPFVADFAAKLPHYVHVAIEEPWAYEISMNGRPVTGTEHGSGGLGWWRDIAFRRLDVTGLVNPQSTNHIVLRRLITGEAERKRLMSLPETTPEHRNRLRYGTEIESIYVLGEFRVLSRGKFEPIARRTVRTQGGFVITDGRSQARTGDLAEQGLPFYAGRVRLSQPVILHDKLLKSSKGALLHFDPPDAVVTKVFVNGHPAGTRAWRPYDFEIGRLLVPGRNDLRVELAGSCRNLLGPHHHVNGELYGVSPWSFRGTKSWTDDPSDPENVWTDAYSFVRFGLAGPASLALWK